MVVFKRMKKLIILPSLLGCLCAPAVAQDPNNLDSLKAIYAQLGAHTEFYNNIQNDSSGGVRKFDLAPVLGVGFFFPIVYGFHLIPEINWVLPQSAGSSRIIKNLFMFRADVAYDPLEWLRLRLGTSLMFQNYQGRGGKENISNGESSSTFYYPDENRSAFNNTLDAGIEGLIDANWSVRLQTYTYSLFRPETRQLSYTLFVTYYWNK